jgi:hypothetical protein
VGDALDALSACHAVHACFGVSLAKRRSFDVPIRLRGRGRGPPAGARQLITYASRTIQTLRLDRLLEMDDGPEQRFSCKDQTLNS